MKINKSAWHYKLWKKSFNGYNEYAPSETDLCRYCHRVFWQVLGLAVLAALLVVTIGGGLALLGIGLYQGLWKHTGTSLLVLGAIAAAVGVVYLYQRWLCGKPKPKQDDNLVGSWMAARKENVCPLIDFEDEE